MNEIVIEHKKYISTKQAAALTGYAKDYVGQLCREGRVPARLIGRSWYVLESALKDHRHGSVSSVEEDSRKEKERPTVVSTWQEPRYKTEQAYFPSLNKITAPFTPVSNMPTIPDTKQKADIEHAIEGSIGKEEQKKVLNMLEVGQEQQSEDQGEDIDAIQDTWKEWFSRMPAPTGSMEDSVFGTGGGVSIPIHHVAYESQKPVIPLEPIGEHSPPKQEETVPTGTKRRPSRISPNACRAVVIACFILLSATTFMSILGSGILDSYISGNLVLERMAGITTIEVRK